MSIDLNVRHCNNKELLLFPPSVGDYIPKNHLARIVDAAVDEIDLVPYYNKISNFGNPPYHPALMIKIWFYGYTTKIYNSRKIGEKLNTDVALIYLAGIMNFRKISKTKNNK